LIVFNATETITLRKMPGPRTVV